MWWATFLPSTAPCTSAGAEGLFADMHPELSFANGDLRVEKPFDSTVALEGRGLVFVPSAFVWPLLVAITEPPWQPTLIYPARGVGALREPTQAAQPAAVRALLGERRASVLDALGVPRSTTELAHHLDVSPGSVSQHLAVLRAAELVTGHRVGRNVLYVRTPIGDQLAGHR